MNDGLMPNASGQASQGMSIAPAASRSLASAANNTARQIGAALGIAVMGTLAGNPSSAAFTPGLHHAALAATAAWAAAAVLATRAPPAAAGPQRQVGQRRWSQPRTVVGSEGHNVASS